MTEVRYSIVTVIKLTKASLLNSAWFLKAIVEFAKTNQETEWTTTQKPTKSYSPGGIWYIQGSDEGCGKTLLLFSPVFHSWDGQWSLSNLDPRPPARQLQFLSVSRFSVSHPSKISPSSSGFLLCRSSLPPLLNAEHTPVLQGSALRVDQLT